MLAPAFVLQLHNSVLVVSGGRVQSHFPSESLDMLSHVKNAVNGKFLPKQMITIPMSGFQWRKSLRCAPFI